MPARALVLFFVVATLLALAVWPSSAAAQTYDVYSCRLPDGTSIPAAGWIPFGSAGGEPSSIDLTLNRCGQGGGLEAGFAYGGVPPGSDAGWVFAAPSGTAVAAFALQRGISAAAFDGETALGYVATSDTWPGAVVEWLDSCVPHGGSGACRLGELSGWRSAPLFDVERSGLTRSRLHVGLRCLGPMRCATDSDAGVVRQLVVHSARVTLADPSAPGFVQDPVIDRVRRAVYVSTADVGGGVAEVGLEVDDAFVALQSLGDATCRSPFIQPVPCPLRAEAELPLPLALPEGPHSMRVRAVDAAGNVSWSQGMEFSVQGGAIIVSSSAAPPMVGSSPVTAGGRLRAWFSGRSRATVRTLRFGDSATVEGVLTDAAGRPPPVERSGRLSGRSAVRPGRTVPCAPTPLAGSERASWPERTG